MNMRLQPHRGGLRGLSVGYFVQLHLRGLLGSMRARVRVLRPEPR
ncbi:MAG TPA: hypothetical protein VH305_05180 [Gaiella sp.]